MGQEKDSYEKSEGNLWQDQQTPYLVSHLKTGEILYASQEFLQQCQLSKSVIGKELCQVLELSSQQQQELEENRDKGIREAVSIMTFSPTAQSPALTLYFRPMPEGNVLLCQCAAVPEMTAQTGTSPLESAINRCVEIFSLPAEEMSSAYLDLLCQFYHCDTACVHRLDVDNHGIECIASAKKEPEQCQVTSALEGENSKLFFRWIEEEVTEKHCFLDFTQDFPHESLKNIFLSKNVQNMSLCAVEDVKKNVLGLLTLTNLDQSQQSLDPRLLLVVSHFLAQDVAQGFVEAKFDQLNHRDSLTGLYNRVGYANRVDEILESRPRSLGVVSANVNGLRFINEKLGPTGGDDCIKTTGKRLKSHFGFDIFRMSGDEFLGIVPDMEKEELESMVLSLQQSLDHEENREFSLGHAWTTGEIDLTKLTFEAETIMYINKQEYYANSKRRFNTVDDSTLADLLCYLENDEFMVYLQPQVRLEDASLHGAEALIRRFDKTNKKMVFPDQFIPLYEKKSIIRHVDIFVVETVCQLLKEWNDEGNAVPISVNLSRVTLQEYGIVDTIVAICEKHQVPHEYLVIEVTERVGLIENNVASSLIMDFKKHGFSISLDDFGCAYSNIVTLAQIDVDEVKIDKSLVDDLIINPKNTIIVESVLSMCHKLEKTSTLAEGIEDEEQANMLRDLACKLGQGYFYSRPIPVPEFVEKYIRAENM